MATGRFKITSLSFPDNGARPLRGKDVQVLVEGPNGVELLVPAMSLVLKIASHGELAIATIEVPVVLVSIDVADEQIKIVGDTIPADAVEATFSQALGADADTTFAAPEHYAVPERGTAEKLPPRGPQSAWEAQRAAQRAPVVQAPVPAAAGDDPYSHLLQPVPLRVVPYRAAPLEAAGPDPLAELDRVIARGGVVDP